ncbi:MAG: HEAT repeat domain-containing protein, partial [Planctomycetia bacterium]|nr:HEAT repeat domain-containing protein [Planctomycetia bacterium]
MRIASAIILLALASVRPAHAQRHLKDIPPPDPVAELAAMEVADGYEVQLFAADPLISKPLQMNFDTRGRMWVSSSGVYPQIRPGEVANDTVTILEDKDGDGRADAATTFADGLLMPTAVLPDDRGGAYVANSTELLHFADTNGDAKADSRRVVLSGFGAEDTHHIIHTFRWGPDARLYFSQSIYIHSHVETPQGVKRLNGGGIWRFEPRSVALDVFARGWVNTWGHAFDRWGRSLTTDGAGGEGISYGFPGAAYQAAVGTSRILHGMNPGSPKLCGLEIIDGRHLPDDAQGVLVTNDFRANRVCRFRLTEAGSGFTSAKLTDLIHSKRVTFRPIDVKMGPDGAIYIADWYNPIIQHGEVDFRDERRDRTHGRIWRVTAKGRSLVPRIDFTTLSVAELLAQIGAAESYARDMARRELLVRGSAAVRPEIDRWLAGLDDRSGDFERMRLEALRLKQGFDAGGVSDVDSALLKNVLASADSRARAAACRIVSDWADRLEQPVELLARAVDDPAPQVRLEAVRALGGLGGQRAAELALHAVDHDRDDALDYSIWLTARELRDAWLPAVLAGTFDDGGKISRLAFAIEAA